MSILNKELHIPKGKLFLLNSFLFFLCLCVYLYFSTNWFLVSHFDNEVSKAFHSVGGLGWGSLYISFMGLAFSFFLVVAAFISIMTKALHNQYKVNFYPMLFIFLLVIQVLSSLPYILYKLIGIHSYTTTVINILNTVSNISSIAYVLLTLYFVIISISTSPN